MVPEVPSWLASQAIDGFLLPGQGIRGSCSGQACRLGQLPPWGAVGVALCARQVKPGFAGEGSLAGHSQAMACFVAHVGLMQMLHSGNRRIRARQARGPPTAGKHWWPGVGRGEQQSQARSGQQP